MGAIKRVRQYQPKRKLPAVVQMRKTEEFLAETERQAGKMRRLLWIAIKKAGGKIAFTSADYREAFEAPANERIVGVEEEGDGYALVFQDAEGKRLPESEKPLVILTDA